jgi:predicted AlkP superfamily pyrophosphatase or phosphodiesterase
MRIRRLLLRALPILFLVSCQSAPPAPRTSPAAPSGKSSRVILLSLDGAGAEELQRLYKAGSLKAGGFARFFQEGQVADRLIPVNPSLTAVNHISLAAGYPAGQTGIVSNTFHPHDSSDLLRTVSGFAAPIETETLWEAAKRQGKKVGVTTWPGADGTNPRRTADWGMIYVNDADRRAELVSLERDRWQPANSRGIGSRSPEIDTEVKAGTQTFRLLAVDRTDDGRTNYDGLFVMQVRDEGRPSSPATPLGAGAWADIPCQVTPEKAPPRETVCTVKILEIAPDLSRVRVYFGGVYPLQAYPPELATDLERKGLVWPGPPDDRRLSDSWAGKPGIDLQTWLQQSDRFTRFFGDSLIDAVKRPDWDLMMGYVPVIDEAGHQLTLTDPRQSGFSPARRDEFAAARLRVWQDVDRELARLLAALDLGTTAVIVVSDHGMTPTHTQVDPNVLLWQNGFLAIADGKVKKEGTVVYAVGSGGIIHVYAPGRADLVPTLRTLFTDWLVEGENPVERVLTRQEAADAGIALGHLNSGDLVVFLREGYSAHGNLLREEKTSAPSSALGMHGYLNTHPDMHAVYMAVGAGIGKGNPGTVRNPEVAGRVADLLGMEKPKPAP